MDTFLVIILLLLVANGIHCIVLAWKLRSTLLKLGIKSTYFSGGSVSDIIKLNNRIKLISTTRERKKYKKFVRYIIVAYLVELLLVITLFFYVV